jgi:hypothetical protein
VRDIEKKRIALKKKALLQWYLQRTDRVSHPPSAY